MLNYLELKGEKLFKTVKYFKCWYNPYPDSLPIKTKFDNDWF